MGSINRGKNTSMRLAAVHMGALGSFRYIYKLELD